LLCAPPEHQARERERETEVKDAVTSSKGTNFDERRLSASRCVQDLGLSSVPSPVVVGLNIVFVFGVKKHVCFDLIDDSIDLERHEQIFAPNDKQPLLIFF
jgi:hypothetical protein